MIESAKQAKFKLEFFLLLWGVGRDEEAKTILKQVYDWLDSQS